MQSAFIINDRTGKPYAVVGILAGGTEFYPIAESAVSWASWMTADFAAKKITKQQLSVTLDNSMSLEGPMPANRANQSKLDELIKKAKKIRNIESDTDKEGTEEKVLLPVISLIDARLDNLENEDWRNAVNFKAKSFIADANKSTFAYEVKRTRAVWDPSLAVPGTQRRGGFRCPPGTRYGGQITDRFGRNCGWGVARRLANEIADIGERVENVDDRRRERRVNRRNDRMVRRLQQGGRVERAARAVGNALESKPTEDRGPGRIERIARRVGDALDTPGTSGRPRRNLRGEGRRPGEGRLEAAVRRLEEIADAPTPAPRRPRPAAPQARPARPRRPRNPAVDANNPYVQRLRELDDRELEKEWIKARKNSDSLIDAVDRPNPNGQIGMLPVSVQRDAARSRLNAVEAELNRRKMRPPLAEYNAEVNNRQRPGAPRAPRRVNAGGRPRQPRPADNVSKTPVPAGAPRAAETLQEYKRRKYNEHQARVRKIREEGGNAGFLRYEEWEQFHGPAVEDNWNRAQQRNGGRGRRRAATDAGAANSANRRPSAADEPDAVQPARRQRRPFNAYGQRGVASEAAARRKRAVLERQDPVPVDGYQIVKYNDKYFVVPKKEVDRANARGANLDVVNEAPRPRPRAPRFLPPLPAVDMVRRFNPRRPDGVDDELWDEYLAYGNQQVGEPLAFNRWAQAQRDLGRDINWPPGQVLRTGGGVRTPAGRARPVIPVGQGGGAALRPAPRVTPAHGDIIERPAEFKDGKIALPKPNSSTRKMTKDQAIQHVKDGKDVSLVPREHLLAAIEADLRTAQNPNGRFIPENFRPGAIGDTRIYVQVDRNGQPMKRGYVFKGASSGDNLGELLGFNLAAAHGFDIDGAQADGRAQGRRGVMDFMVIPHAQNNIPDGWKQVISPDNDGRNFQVMELNRLPDVAAPQRVAHLLHNHLLGVGDRHGNNGHAMVFEKPDGTKVAHIVPIDQGWAGHIGTPDPITYAQAFRMDADIFSDIKGHIRGIADPAEKERQKQEIIKAVDDMIARSAAVVSNGPEALKETIIAAYPNADQREVDEKVQIIFGKYKAKAQGLKDNRERLLQKLGVA